VAFNKASKEGLTTSELVRNIIIKELKKIGSPQKQDRNPIKKARAGIRGP